MSNVRDLFSNSGIGGLGFSLRREEVSEYFVIDGEKRTITPPNDFENFGVESDENTERVWFECPKVVGDDIDLTTYNLYINFRNANGEADKYLVEDVESDGELIHFSWVLSRKLTKYKGTVHFVVCAIKTDKYGKIANEWNTTLCSGDVLEGLEVENPTVDESTSDIIDQLVNLAKKSVADVESARATALEELKSAPSLEHSSRFANALKATASGNVVQVDDVSPNEHYVTVKVSGENINPADVTITRCGKNLFDTTKYITRTNTVNGVTVEMLDDGCIHVHGTPVDTTTATSITMVHHQEVDVLPKGTYIYSNNPSVEDDNVLCFPQANNPTNGAWLINLLTERTYVPEDFCINRFVVVVKAGATSAINNKYYLQVEAGEVASEYEAYKDALTYTPNADGTVDIVSVSPTMTLFTDTEGVTLEVEYVRDTAKALEDCGADIENGKGENSLQQPPETASWAPTNTRITDFLESVNYTTGDGAVVQRDENGNLKVGAFGKNSTMTNAKSQTVGGKTHAGGSKSLAFENNALAHGNAAFAGGKHSGALNNETCALGNSALAINNGTTARGDFSFASGNFTEANGKASDAGGTRTKADGDYSFVRNYYNKAPGDFASAFGDSTIAGDRCAFSTGSLSVAGNVNTFTEGHRTIAMGQQAHAENCKTIAGVRGFKILSRTSWIFEELEDGSEVCPIYLDSCEGLEIGDVITIITNRVFLDVATIKSVNKSSNTIEAVNFTESPVLSWASDTSLDMLFVRQKPTIGTTTVGHHSHCEGYGTVAIADGQHVQGIYNELDATCKYLDIVGNGKDEYGRSNAYTLDKEGNGWFAGDVEAQRVILTSPNGTRFALSVDDNGNLKTTRC